MNCEEVRRRLIDRALEELPAEQIHPLEEHLGGCAACVQAWEEISATYGLLAQGLLATEVPRHFQLVPSDVPAGWWERVWVPALRLGLGAGVALLLLVGSLALFGVSFTRQDGATRVAFGREPVAAPAISRAEIEQVVAARLEEAERRLAQQQRVEIGRLAASLKLANSRQAERLHLLQSAQNQMWKETQRSQYLVELVARNVVPLPVETPK